MAKQNTASVRSYSANFTGRKLSKYSKTSVLSDARSLRCLKASSSTLQEGRATKAAINQRTCSNVNTQKYTRKLKSPSSCLYLDDASADLAPGDHIQTLKSRSVNLQRKLCDVKNKNQIIRRQVWMAEKAIKSVIGNSFDDLTQKATGKSWKGRQELIYSLKRKFLKLRKKVESLEKDSDSTPNRWMFEPRGEVSDVSSIADERQDFWCLELDKRGILKSANEEKQFCINNRDILKDKLESWTKKKQEVADEIKCLQEKISKIPKTADEGIVDGLCKLENQLKNELDGKFEDRQKLNNIEKHTCRNIKAIDEIQKKITQEKQTLKDKDNVLKSLKSKQSYLLEKADEVIKEEEKEKSGMEKKLNDGEKEYIEIISQVERVVSLMSDSKSTVEKFKESHKKCNFSKLMAKKQQFDTKDMEVKSSQMNDRVMPKSKSHSKHGCISKTSREFNGKSNLSLYRDRLRKYSIKFGELESKNTEKLNQIHSAIGKLQEVVRTYLKDRCVLWNITYEVNVLKSQLKKIQKAKSNSSKLKLVKRKDSYQQLVEKEGRKQYLSTLNAESKFMKTLIKRVFNSEQDDIDLLESLLCNNKDLFLQSLSKCDV